TRHWPSTRMASDGERGLRTHSFHDVGLGCGLGLHGLSRSSLVSDGVVRCGEQGRVGPFEALRIADAVEDDESQQVAAGLLVTAHRCVESVPAAWAVRHRQTKAAENLPMTDYCRVIE